MHIEVNGYFTSQTPSINVDFVLYFLIHKLILKTVTLLLNDQSSFDNNRDT